VTETVALIVALAATTGAGGVIIAPTRRCAGQERSRRLLRDALVASKPAVPPELRVIPGGRR